MTAGEGIADLRPLWRSQDQVQIARMKAAHDPPGRSVQRADLTGHRPFAGQRPLIERQSRRRRVEVALAGSHAARGRQVLGSQATEPRTPTDPALASPRRAPIDQPIVESLVIPLAMV